MFKKESKNSFKLILNENTKDPSAEEMRAYLISHYGDYEENKFDIEAAIYWFSTLYHNGQWSNLYSALSTSDYSPGSMENAPVPGGDVEYKYLLDDIVYETNELVNPDKSKKLQFSPLLLLKKYSGNGNGGGIDDDDGDDDDGDAYWFKIKKSLMEFEKTGEIDTDDLERKMKVFLKQITKKNIHSFSYELEETKQLEETMPDMMFGSLVDEYSK